MITKPKLTALDFKPGFQFVPPGGAGRAYEVLHVNGNEVKIRRLDGTIAFANIEKLVDLLNN